MTKEKYRVLVDTDPGLGKKGADIDDGLALFLMLKNSEIFKIEGITTVFGNTRVKKGYSLLKQYLELVKRTEIPHFMGASSDKELGKLNQASRFIIETVKENPDEIILMTLGPLTNVSTALDHYPELFDDLKKIVFMGGLLEPMKDSEFLLNLGDLFKTTEFNFYRDPKATKMFIETNTFTPRIGMGLDICKKVLFQEKHLKKIQEVEKPIPRFIGKYIAHWLNFWKLNNINGFYPFDTFVPIYFLKPELFTNREVFLRVDTEEIKGRLIILKEKNKNSAPITYCMDLADQIGPDEFMNILVSNLIK
jgi:inosine-uridine nucleoside N-ribohydrolase